jgi:hypothetical protein
LKNKTLLHKPSDFSKIMSKAFHSVPISIVVLSLFGAGFASAQSSDISPYSRYGIGDLQDQSSVLNFSMGGTGIAYHNDESTPFFINLKNPASYAYNFIPVEDSAGKGGLKMAAFEAGVQDNILSLTTQGQTIHSNNAYLAYVALNIPISKHFGLGMGLTPVSTTGYNITTSSYIDSTTPSKQIVPSSTAVQTQYQGIGGVNKVFVGLAWAPSKSFSIGGNLSYLFGNLTNEEDIYFPGNVSAFNSFKIENIGIHSFDADFGMMFNQKLWGDWSITIGATIAPSFNISSNYTLFAGPQFVNGAGVYTMDTIQDSNANGKIKIPLSYGVGITIKKGEHWTISIDRSGQNWSQYSFFGQTENLTDSYKWGVGLQYVPNKVYPKNFLQRVHYRLGFSYGQNYLDLYNTPLIDKSFSAGIGVPVGSSNPFNHPAVVNIGVQFGYLGTTTNNLLLENYVKIMVGFTFDDHWFEKRKFQ